MEDSHVGTNGFTLKSALDGTLVRIFLRGKKKKPQGEERTRKKALLSEKPAFPGPWALPWASAASPQVEGALPQAYSRLLYSQK